MRLTRVPFVILAAVIVCAYSAVAWADDAGPGRISTLTASPGKTTAALYWTAGGGDCSSGNASTFEIRQSTSAITDTNWQTNSSVVASGASATNGNPQCASLSSLTCNTTYYWVVFTFDSSGNRSPLGNVASTTTLACIPQSAEIYCE